MWLSFSSDMTDLELTDYADRYLTDLFSTVEELVGFVWEERELSLRVWLDPLALAARDLTTQEVELVLRKENIEFPAGRIESKDVDLTIKLDKAYKNLDSYKKLPLKRARDGSIITLSDVAKVELGAESLELYLKVTENKLLVLASISNQMQILLNLQMVLRKKLKKLDQDYHLGHP